VPEDEAKQLYETFAVPASGLPLFQAAAANLNPWTEAKVDTENPSSRVGGKPEHAGRVTCLGRGWLEPVRVSGDAR
jgi:hypothetical protein